MRIYHLLCVYITSYAYISLVHVSTYLKDNTFDVTVINHYHYCNATNIHLLHLHLPQTDFNWKKPKYVHTVTLD